MKLTRYTGKTEFDAIENMKKQLGAEADDAIIMNTKKVRAKGFFGFFKKKQYEILVGIDEKKPEPAIKQAEFESLLKDNLETKQELKDIKEVIVKMSEDLEKKNKQEQAKTTRKSRKRKKASKNQDLIDNLADDYDNYDDYDDYDDFDDSNDAQDEVYVNDYQDYLDQKAAREERENNTPQPSKKGKKVEHMELYKHLTAKGVNDELSLDMCELIMRQLSGKEASEEHIRRLAKISIKNMLGNPYQIPETNKKQSIFFFIGPTGVGKTTTIAKIATKLSFIEGRDLALITTDTFRIAAVEQLRVYGDILNLPISVVYKPLEFKEVLHKYKDKDIILVDTAGKSHLDEGMQEYISSYLECAPDSEKFLLISLTTSYKDIESIVKSYSFLDDYKLIFTKIDEASMPGNVLNIKQKTGRNTSFITNGQSVPDDIIVADPEEIAKIILGE